MSLALGILVYPGAALLAALTLLLARAARPRLAFGARGPLALLGLLAIGLALLALLALPWPSHPLGPGNRLLIGWAAAEAAAALLTLAALARGGPAAAREAVRSAQIGASGRAVVFAALIGVPPLATVSALPGGLLLLAGALLALPAAATAGPFGPETSLGPEGAEAGLSAPQAALLRVARAAVGAVAAGAWGCLGAALLPAGGLRLAAALLLAVAGALLPLLLRDLPRLTTLQALRWCWGRALPVSAIGLLYLAALSARGGS